MSIFHRIIHFTKQEHVTLASTPAKGFLGESAFVPIAVEQMQSPKDIISAKKQVLVEEKDQTELIRDTEVGNGARSLSLSFFWKSISILLLLVGDNV